MKFNRSTVIKLFASFLVTLIVVLGIIYNSTKVNSINKPMPVAQNGVLDLRDWDFKKDGMVKLDGQWEYYDKQFLLPEDFNNNVSQKSYVSIPGVYAIHGHGTLRLRLLLKEANDASSIKIEFLQSAYKLWANDQEIISAGSVGASKQEMKPRIMPKTASFSAKSGQVDLTLQVSNYFSKLGAIDTIVVGESTQIMNNVRKRLAFDLFLFGSAIMAALYNLGLFIKRKKNIASLYSAIVCSIVATRTIFLGERFIYSIIPNFSHMIAGKIMFWTFYLYIPIIVLFIQSFYNRILPGWIIKISTGSAFVYFLAILFSPNKHYVNIILPFEIFTGLILLYILYKVSKECIEKNSSDYIMAVGIFALFLTRMNDILYEYSIIITGSFGSLGALVFILANSYILAERQAIAINNSEDLSEKLESLNNLKDEFLAITSHELKTPLNGIIGLSENLNSSSGNNLSEDEKKNLCLINTSAKRLSNLVNDIMVFSRLKNNDITLQKKTVDISKLADIVVKFCSLTISNKEVSIVNSIGIKAPCVFGDEERIQQIFFNLIGNAVKFTSQGTIRLSYKLKDSFLEICIEDTGIGIPEHKLKNIFNMYEKVEGISEKYGGTGLGLYITRKLVELHGGTIRAASIEGEGSTFSFTLPVCKINNGSELSPAAGWKDADFDRTTEKNDSKDSVYKGSGESGASAEDKRYKILIVDDEYINQRVLEMYLSKNNSIILKASTGREAIKLVEVNKDLDLVILDMMMPDLLGFEVSSVIREKYSLFELPILIMTANNNLNNLVSSFKCGANDYLAKPFNQNELLARVNTLIALKRSVEKALSLGKQITAANEQVEELREYDKLKTELFTNLSHELRTPLNIISSSTQLLGSLNQSKQLTEEKIDQYLGIMNQNSLRLLRLINNIIDMTRLDGNYLTLNLANGDIVYAIEELCQSVAEYIKAQNISIIFDTELEEKHMAFDEEKLERIMLNLLSNAVKFTDKGGSIYVNVYDHGHSLKISVRDTGVGVPKDKLDFIFQRFAQLDKSLNRRNEGSGIGLSLVKSLVEMQGGHIYAESELGKGTEFVIELPVRLVDEEVVENAVAEDKESRYEKNLQMEFADIYL
jgi:two-component system, sensor histidine kinase ChiS